MRKIFLLSIVTIFIFPFIVCAEGEEKIVLTCDKLDVKKDEEIECQIIASNLDFITTSISGKIKLDNNLELISSSYDNESWQMLDEEFSVENINLISESIEEKDSFTIATFKVKAVNTETTMASVFFEDVLLGDENYENHEIDVNSVKIYMEYINVSNPNTSLDTPLTICIWIVIFGVLGYSVLKNKRYI